MYIYAFVPMVSFLGFMSFIKGGDRFFIFNLLGVTTTTLLLLALRNPLAPYDSGNYMQMYNSLGQFSDVFYVYHGSVFFSLLQYCGKVIGFTFEQFSIFLSFICYCATLIGFRLITKSNKVFLMGLCLFSLGSTFVLLYTNTVRQGFALSLIILSSGFFIRKYNFLGYLALVLAVFSHFSALLVLLGFWVVRTFHLKNKHLLVVLIVMPLIPFFSQYFISNFSVLGGVFQKIEKFSASDYGNHLVYIKVASLYLSLLLFFFLGVSRGAFLNFEFRFIFNVYAMMVFVCVVFLPILLLSSRYLYYASAFLPILYAFIFFQQPNLFGVNIRFFVGFGAALLYGFFVYSFESTRTQLGG